MYFIDELVSDKAYNIEFVLNTTLGFLKLSFIGLCSRKAKKCSKSSWHSSEFASFSLLFLIKQIFYQVLIKTAAFQNREHAHEYSSSNTHKIVESTDISEVVPNCVERPLYLNHIIIHVKFNLE